MTDSKRPVVAIGIPTTGNPHWRFSADLMGLQMVGNSIVLWQPRTMIDTARNVLVEKALSNVDVTHLLMIDDDMTFKPDALKKLIENDVDIVAGLAFKRTPNYAPCVYMKKHGTNDHYAILPEVFQEVDVVGTGFILIKREVLEKIKSPRFETWYDKENIDKHWSVDFDFCMKAKAAGFKVFVDPMVEVGHIGNAPIITKQTFLQHQHFTRLKQEEMNKANNNT